MKQYVLALFQVVSSFNICSPVCVFYFHLKIIMVRQSTFYWKPPIPLRQHRIYCLRQNEETYHINRTNLSQEIHLFDINKRMHMKEGK